MLLSQKVSPKKVVMERQKLEEWEKKPEDVGRVNSKLDYASQTDVTMERVGFLQTHKAHFIPLC